jgi:hypothetical protein
MAAAGGPFPPEVRTGSIIEGGDTFEYTLWIRPRYLKRAIQRTIISIIGDRVREGSVCLEITANDVKDNILSDNTAVYGIVENKTLQDAGVSDITTGSLQYTDWCNKPDWHGTEQVWVHDLCRVKPKGLTRKSTAAILLKIFEDFVFSKGITSLYLFVDPFADNYHFLLDLYSRVYNFIALPKPFKDGYCRGTNMYTVMRKALPDRREAVGGCTRRQCSRKRTIRRRKLRKTSRRASQKN